jgi:hypothetical protein
LDHADRGTWLRLNRLKLALVASNLSLLALLGGSVTARTSGSPAKSSSPIRSVSSTKR